MADEETKKLEVIKEYIKEQERIKESLEQQIERQKLQVELAKEVYGQASSYTSIQQKQLDILEKEKDSLQEIAKLRQQESVDEKQLLELLVKKSKEIAKIKDDIKATQKGLDAGESIAKMLGIDPSGKESIFKNISASISNFSGVQEGFVNQIEKVGGGLKATGMIAGMLASKLIDLSKEQSKFADESVSGFVAATGAASKYTDIIYATARGNTQFGISFKESSKAVSDLYTGLNTFTSLSVATQKELTITAAKLEKLGISGTETASSIKTLSITMGVTEEQSAKVVKQFVAMGMGMGIAAKQIISDFNSVKDQLAVFGNKIGEVFTKLEAQSKATGVSIADLTNYANKFDTFEGAATQVAKLNAVLDGPYLSAMSMIETTDPTERINMIREAVNNANLSFDEMGYYEKKAIMEAGGFKSVEEAQRILSMSAGEAAEQLQAQQASQKELDDAIQRSIPIQQKLQLIMSNFAIVMGPAINAISSFMSGLASFVDSDTGKGVIAIIQAIIAALVVLATIGTGPWGLFAAGVSAIATALASVHFWFLEPNSPIMYDVFLGLPNLFGSISQAAVNTAGAVYDIAKSFMSLHDSSVDVSYLLEMATGLYAVGEALNTIESDKALNMKVVMEKIVEVSQPTNLKGFEQFSEKFDLVAQATAKVDASKTQTFTNLLTATQNLSQSLKLNQTVIVKIGDKKFEGVITEVIDKTMGSNATSYTTT